MTPTNTAGSSDRRRLCSDCVFDVALQQRIVQEGTRATCSYCGENGHTLSINEIADFVKDLLQQFYEWVESAHTEEDAVLRTPQGQPVNQVIDSLVDARVSVAEEIRKLLADLDAADPDKWNLALGLFNPGARYARRQTLETYELEMSWLGFERNLKTQTRYFNRRADDLLRSIFEGMDGRRAIDGRPIVVVAGPEKDFSTFYRARVFQKEEEFRKALKRPHVNVGPPPPSDATAGRMNAAGISVFYGATTPEIALSEVRPPVGSKVLIGSFEVIRTLRLLDLVALAELADENGSLFDNEYVDRLRRGEFLRGLTQRFSKPVMPNDQALEYLPTQAVADFLAASAEPPFDGVLYPSVQHSQIHRARRRYRLFGANRRYACNVVLFHQAARVQCLNEAEDLFVTDGSFFFWDSETLDQGPEVEYSTWAPPPSEVETADEATLRLASLQAHYITAVKVESEPIKLNRFTRGESGADSPSV